MNKPIALSSGKDLTETGLLKKFHKTQSQISYKGIQ